MLVGWCVVKKQASAHFALQVEQQHPFHQQPNGWRAGLAACLAHPACQADVAPAGEQRCQLLLAAICCRDAALCTRLVEGAGDACWGRHATNCHLLVSAAEHDLPAVLSALLALRTAGGGQPFSPGMHHEGCSPLAAAAERNSCAALRMLLQRGADVHAAGPDGLPPLHWAVIGGAYEAAELLLQAGARWVGAVGAGERRAGMTRAAPLHALPTCCRPGALSLHVLAIALPTVDPLPGRLPIQPSSCRSHHASTPAPAVPTSPAPPTAAGSI